MNRRDSARHDGAAAAVVLAADDLKLPPWADSMLSRPPVALPVR
jgi:hypothetical protein